MTTTHTTPSATLPLAMSAALTGTPVLAALTMPRATFTGRARTTGATTIRTAHTTPAAGSAKPTKPTDPTTATHPRGEHRPTVAAA